MSKPAPKGGGGAASASGNILQAVHQILALKASIRTLNENGTFTDADHKKVADLEKKIADAKLKAAKDLTAAHKPPKKRFVADEAGMEELADFMQTLVEETDIKAGNLELLKAMMSCCALDVPALCEERGLLAAACADGSKAYVEALLQHTPPIRFDAAEVMAVAFFNQQCRIPLTLLLLKYEKQLGLQNCVEELHSNWVDFFADIASKKRAIPKEDRTGRMQLIEKLATHKMYPIDPNAEGPDAQTVFSRAAHEGDAELMRALIKLKVAPDVNRVQSDNTTALIQAVFSNNVETVQLLLSFAEIDVNHESNDGTALALAETLMRSSDIIKALRAKGAEEKGNPTLTRAPTFAVPQRKVPHPPPGESGAAPINPRQAAIAAAEAAEKKAIAELERRKEEELRDIEPKKKNTKNVVVLEPLAQTQRTVSPMPPGQPQAQLNPRQLALIADKALALRVLRNWTESVKAKGFVRRRSMLQKVIMFGGTAQTKLRMYFREWHNFALQRKLQKRMDMIRETIAKRNEARKERLGNKAVARTISPPQRNRSQSRFSLMDCVNLIRLTKQSIDSMHAMGSFTDDEMAKTERANVSIQEMKASGAAALETSDTLMVPTEEEAADLADFFEELILATDINKGNLELVRAFVRKVKLDFPTLCEERGLVATAAADGSLGYLEVLLGIPNVRFDTVEVVSCAFFNQQCRIPLTLLLLRYESILKLPDFVDDLQDMWTEFFADIASKKRAIPKEDRTGRMQLIEKLATHKIMKVDQSLEGPDAQTVFSRAAHEGDAELMQLLLRLKVAPDVNRVQSDNTTALIQAVFSDNAAAVNLLLSQRGIDANHETSDGTALTIARSLKRDPAIIAALVAKGAAEGPAGSSTLARAPTFAAPKPKEPMDALAKANDAALTPRPPKQPLPLERPSGKVATVPPAADAAKKRQEALSKALPEVRKASLGAKVAKR